MKKALKRRMICWLTAVALVATMFVPITASAADASWSAPTFAIPVDNTIVKVGAHSAAVTAVHYLGGNLVTERRTDFGDINNAPNAAAKLAAAQTYTQLGVFGTGLNESPDPYLWNYLYNLYAATKDKAAVNDAFYMVDIGSPADADTTVIEDIGTSYTLARKPEVLIGINTPVGKPSYDELIDQLNSGKSIADPNFYDPLQVNYKMTTIYEQSETMYALSDAIIASGKVGRYGDTNEIAQTYEKFLKGTQLYVLSCLENAGEDKKVVAVVDPTPQANGSYKAYTSNDTLGTAASNRSAEYVENTTINLLDAISPGTPGFFTPQELVQADVIIAAAGGGATTQTESQVTTALTNAGIDSGDIPPIYCTAPKTTFGIVMNSVENIYGIPIYQGFVYPEYINPLYGAMYLYEKMYHLADLDTVKSLVTANFQTASVSTEVDRDLSAYNTGLVQGWIDTGLEYYSDNEGDFAGKKLELSERVSSEAPAPRTNINELTITPPATVAYKGSAHTPVITLKDGATTLTEGTDYIIAHSNNVNAGTASITIRGKGQYTGTKVVNYAIAKAAQKVTIPAAYSKTFGSAAFSAGAKRTVGDGALSYASDNAAVAAVSASGVITLKGPGKAVITATAAATTNYSAVSARTTVTVAPKKVSISKLSSKKKTATVTWGSDSKNTGYEILLATNSKFSSNKKTVTVSGGSKKTTTVKSLKKGKTYYVKVRAYKTVDGKKVYGAYSAVKKIKIK